MIDSITIGVTKKIIKGLNDINQDLKTIFSEYYLYPDGIIVSEPEKYLYNVGSHMCKIEYLPVEELKSYILKLYSDKIYKTVKDYKKIIDSISVESGTIYLSGDGQKFHVGELIDIDSIKAKTIEKIYLDSVEKFNKCSLNTKRMTIDAEDVEALVKNEFRYANIDKYSTRVTRGIAPGLKKSHSLSIWFNDLDDERLYNMMLDVERATVHSYHIYTCIFTK